MTRRNGLIDAGSVGMAMAGLAAGLFARSGEPLSIYCLDDDLFGRRRRRDTVDKPRRETSRAPAPLPGNLKHWAAPVVVEMPRQQRRAVTRQLEKRRACAPVGEAG